MPRKSPYVISFAGNEHKTLQEIARKYTSPYYLVVRAKAIILASEGLENIEIGKRLDIPRQIVSKWRKRFFHERLDGLYDRPREGRPRSFPP